nr:MULTISPECIES: hypothetical protein [Streptomyces]
MAWATCAGSTVGAAAADAEPPRADEPLPDVAGVCPASALVTFACAAVSAASAWARVSLAAVASTFPSTCPAVTLSPALTSTSVSRPPVAKFTPASLGELREPEPETVARTVALVTVAVRAPPRAGAPAPLVTAA